MAARTPTLPPHGNAQRFLIERMHRREAPLFGLAQELGLRFPELGPGRVVLELDVTPRFHNPAGIVHGGVIFGLLDTAMGFAATSILEGATWVSTVDVKVNFMRAVRAGRLRAEGLVARKGRTLVHIAATATNEAGELVAEALGTGVIVPGSPDPTDA